MSSRKAKRKNSMISKAGISGPRAVSSIAGPGSVELRSVAVAVF